MELTGDLSDFALTDILQILSLSRKTGTLSLENGRLSGRIVIEAGRITQATYRPGGSFGDYLVRTGRLSVETLGNLKRLVGRDRGYWSLSGLLVESGMMSSAEVNCLAKGYLQSVVSRLLALEKGRFGIDLQEPESRQSLDEVYLPGGLEIGEALLGAATQRDETGRLLRPNPSGEFPHQGSDNFADLSTGETEGYERGRAGFERWYERRPDGAWLVAREGVGGVWEGTEEGAVSAIERGARDGTGADDAGRAERQSSMLCSLLIEMREKSFEAEVSLLIMRFASEIAARGVLFAVTETGLRGFGQYGLRGVDGRSADEMIRDVVIERAEMYPVMLEVLEQQTPVLRIRGEELPFVGIDRIVPSRDGSRNQYFLLPVVAGGKTQFIVYGESDPGAGVIGDREMEELLALAQQAGMVLEKIALERLLQELEASAMHR